MNNEELKQEAKEKWWEEDTVSGASTPNRIFVTGYLAGAEPREKEIKSLGERCLQLQKDKGNLTDRVNNLEEKLANADYQLEGRDNEIRELEEQIEKMKCCGNCQTVRDAEGNCYLKKDGKCKDKDKWELRR